MSFGPACRLLQPYNGARAHPSSDSSSHARGRWSRVSPPPIGSGCVGPLLRFRSRNLRAAIRARRLTRVVLHLRGRDKSRAGVTERRRRLPFCLEKVQTKPSSLHSGHLGHRRNETPVFGGEERAPCRSRSPFVRRPAKGAAIEVIKVPSVVSEPIRDQQRLSTVHA